jgi:pimeloyl-ACP methyl ester carboxylesterase
VLALDLAALVAHLGLTDYDLGGFSLGARTSVRAVIAGLRPKRLVLGGMGLEGLAGWSGRGAFFTDAIDRFDSVKHGDPAFFAVQFMKSMKIDRVAARHLLGTFADTAPEALAALTMPTLVVCGDQDRDNGDPAKLVEALPDARLAIIPGTHMSCVTKPELGQAIRDFLTETVVR